MNIFHLEFYGCLESLCVICTFLQFQAIFQCLMVENMFLQITRTVKKITKQVFGVSKTLEECKKLFKVLLLLSCNASKTKIYFKHNRNDTSEVMTRLSQSVSKSIKLKGMQTYHETRWHV